LLFFAAPRNNRSMLAGLLFELFEFAVLTAVLLGLLWVMIKLQRFNRKYEYRFSRLTLMAGLASALYLVPYAGPFLAFPILWIGVKKVTHADYVEALLTIAVPCALIFGGNHYLVQPIRDDLRARFQKVDILEAIKRQRLRRANAAGAGATNMPAGQTNLSALQTNLLETNPAVRGATASLAPLSPATAKIVKLLSIKGVTRNAANSAVTIQAGAKVYTVFLDEAALMQTSEGPVSVRFAELETNSVILEINGESARFMVH